MQVQKAAERLEAAAKTVAAKPKDPQALKELEEAHQNLLDKMKQVKVLTKVSPKKNFFYIFFLKN